MKKALVLALSVFMVLALATAAFAAEVTYEGKVEVKWGGRTDDDPSFRDEKKEAKVFLDFTKDYGDGVTAGVKTKIENDADQVEWDGSGWVKLERDLFTVQASTGINGGVGKDFGKFDITEAAGLGLDLNLVDGLTINTIVNAGPKYKFLVKGEFAQDLFTIGGGYQNDAVKEKTAFGAYATLNVIDGLTIKGEFGNRKAGDADGATAILASVGYEGLLNATASFYTVKKAFDSIIDKADGFLARDKARFKPAYDFSVIFVDAAYNVTDALAIDGSFDYILSVKEGDDDVEDFEDKLSYKLGATYTFDAFKLEGWYKAYVGSEIGGKATYTLADGVETSFEVKTSKANKDADNVLAYTLLISAAL